jgi:hypothetical protein
MIAETASHVDPAFLGNLVIALGVLSGLGVVGMPVMFGMGKKVRSEVINDPLRTQNHPRPPSHDQHQALVDRVTRIEDNLNGIYTELKDLREMLHKHFVQVISAGAEQEQRISEKMDVQLRDMNARLDGILMPNKQPTKSVGRVSR